MDAKHLGSVIIVVGFTIVLVGVAIRFGLFSWFGRLPGDLRLGGENTRVYGTFSHESTNLPSLVAVILVPSKTTDGGSNGNWNWMLAPSIFTGAVFV